MTLFMRDQLTNEIFRRAGRRRCRIARSRGGPFYSQTESSCSRRAGPGRIAADYGAVLTPRGRAPDATLSAEHDFRPVKAHGLEWVCSSERCV